MVIEWLHQAFISMEHIALTCGDVLARSQRNGTLFASCHRGGAVGVECFSAMEVGAVAVAEVITAIDAAPAVLEAL